MGRKCIKCKYERGNDDTSPEYECPKCGAIYAKVEAMMGLDYRAEGNLSDEDKIRAIKERASLEIRNNSAKTKISNQKGTKNMTDKLILPAFLFCFFFGVFGVHRFYVGKTKTAIIQLVTLGGLGIWAFIDFIMILSGAFTDHKGNKITQWTS